MVGRSRAIAINLKLIIIFVPVQWMKGRVRHINNRMAVEIILSYKKSTTISPQAPRLHDDEW